ncbi:unnamed protein product, partial [Onchocerca ochengi]
FVKKKIEKDKTNSNSSSITNGSEKQAQKDHNKKIAGKGIRKKSSDSSGKIMKKANVKSEKDSEKDSESVKSATEKKEKRKKMKKISGKKERILKTPVESGKSSDKIKEKNLVLKETNGSESENESKSVSESEKKVTKKKSEGKKGKRKKYSEAFHESKTSKDKKKAKKHKDKTSKSMAEKDKIKKSKAKKIKSQHISKESKAKISTGKDKSEGSEKRIKLEEAAEKIKETGKKKSKISGKSKVGKKMDRVDAILPSGNEDESEKMKMQEKLRSKKKSEAKLRKHRGREVKPLEDTKITKQSTLTSTALLGCSSLIPLASSVTSSSPSISDISTSPALTDSSRVKSDISIEPEKPLAPIKEIKNGKKQTIDVKDDRIDDGEKKEQMIRKEPKKEMLKTRMDIRPEKCDVKIKKDLTSTEIPENDRKIMHVKAFTQTNDKVYDMIRRPKQIRYETNKIGETSSDITQKTDIMAKSPELQIAQAIKQSTVTSSIGGQERDSEKKDKSNLDMTELESSEESESGKIKKKKVIKESGTSNMAFSSTKQNGNSKYDDKKISSFREIEIASVTQKTVDIVTNDRQNGRKYSKDEKDEYQEKENLRERKEKSQEKKMKSEKESKHVKNSKKATKTTSPDEINANTRPKESQDRSYVDGLIEIRTILEIYGMEKEKKEAFNKLLDEDKPMNEKEIAENLSKAICDLPMNTELLEKVLKKMQSSGLLEKEQQEMLQKNLVPEAVNESVTIALLAQVLQRQKLKKSTS